MNAKWMRRLTLWASLTAGALSGCAEEREPINRVQADALEKSFFVGKLADSGDDPVFYWRNFVVDASEAQSLVGIGSWSGVDRIRWEITESMLIARRAYPTSDGADDKGRQDRPANGTIVAAYPIVSHFDIKRAYNPSTGEELNVIEENTGDRIWSERAYFRVDWSINLVETPLWFDMFLGKVFGDIRVTPLAYYVNDRTHEDAPHFDTQQGYFDITSKFWVEPQGMESPFIDLTGNVPACLVIGLYTNSAVDNCDPQEAVIRSSYWKAEQVDPDGDFEPFVNTTSNLDIIGNPGGLGDSYTVGIVTPPRIDWDPQYGYTDAGMRKYMHVHDIWQQSHQTVGSCSTNADCRNGGACLPSGTCSVACSYEARGDFDGNGTDDQCENANTGYTGAEGSQCSARDRCTLPYRDRKVRPVAYWMNKETPADLTDAVDAQGNFVSRGPTEDIMYAWNQFLKLSVAKAREVECRRTGAGRAECNAQFFEPGQTEMVSFGGWGIEKVKPLEDDVLVACHNPVRSYDHATCGERGYVARVGDLRHNFLFYWPYSSRAPWGGIANWNADPLTGQIIGASATTMGRSATYAAALVRDIITVANGELSFEDITGGTPAEVFRKELQEGRTPKSFTPEQIQARVASIDAQHAMQQVGPKVAGGTLRDQLKQHILAQKDRVAGVGPASTSQLEFQAIAKKVQGSVAEAQLVDPNWLVDSAGLTPQAQMSDELMNVVSPLRGQDHGTSAATQQLVDLRLQAHGVCFVGPEAGNVGNIDIQGVARFFAQKYSNEALRDRHGMGEANDAELAKRRGDLIYDDLWKQTYKGIQLHEVGHSLGMLHQFASSYDSTNFNPQYWQLRTDEGRAVASCNGTPRSGGTDTCLGPRYLDPETDDELGQGPESRPGINYFGHTSTMEYQNARFFENVGLGQYDLLTMNMLYGRVLQTFDAEAADGVPIADQQQFGVRNWTQLSDYSLAYWNSGPLLGESVQPMHYTEAARRMRLFDAARCRDATPEEIAQAEWRIVHGKVCAPPPKDYAAWDDFESGPSTPDGDAAYSAFKWRVRGDARTAAGSVRWPFRWGVTSNAYPHTNPSDAGADIYEVTVETIRKFDQAYPFTYFRRQQRDWYYRAIPARTASGFYERLRAFHWSMANNNAYFATFGDSIYNEIANMDDFWRPYVMAETEIFNAISRSLFMPQVGQYFPMQPVGQTRALYDPDLGGGRFAPFSMDASTARFIDPDYNGEPDGGGSWDYTHWVNHTGFSVEKSDAAKALTDGRAVFFTIARENYLDGRNVNINFRSDMPQAVDRLVGGMLASDWETIALYVDRFEADVPGSSAEPKVFDLATRGEPKRPDPQSVYLLFPNVGYKQQLGMLVWAHIFARLNTDLTLANKMRIWVDGLVGEVNVPDAQQARFYNPESGLTYIARKYGSELIDGKSVDKGIASRMVQQANNLLIATYEVELDATTGQPLLDAYGMPSLRLDADGQPILKPVNSLTDYRGYVGLLDAAVQVANMVGYGPFDGLPTDFE